MQIKSWRFNCALSIFLYLGLNSFSQGLSARFAYNTFYAPGKGPYIETYITVDGYSTCYEAKGNGLYQATVEASVLILSGDSVRYFDKFNLLGPEINDTINAVKDFSDLHRIQLPNGNYTIELHLSDKNAPGSKDQSLIQAIQIALPEDRIFFSDIELLSDYSPATGEGVFVKNGMMLHPLVDDFYGRDRNRLVFYSEYYKSFDLLGESDLLLTYQILGNESNLPIEKYARFSKQKTQSVGVLLSEFDITDLPSGNFRLQIQLKDKKNQLLASKECFFQRSNPIPMNYDNANADLSGNDFRGTFVTALNDKEALAEHIRSLWPISNPNENTFALNQLGIADLKQMQQFFYDFWYRRSPSNPESAWNKYKEEVQKVNANFSAGKKKGYLTERGRVYLRYGEPNQRTKAYNEPNTYPYEIWQYYTIGNQSNRKFIFYCPEIGGNDFSLLHSDARGEVFESQWKVILKRRTETLNNVDKTNVRSTYGNNFEQLFQNPR